MKLTMVKIGIGITLMGALLAAQHCPAQGVSTNAYINNGPQGPLSVDSTPYGLDGSLGTYYRTWNANLGLTNNVAVLATNYYSPTNTAFPCQDYDWVGVEFIGSVSNGAPGRTVQMALANSDDGVNFDTNDAILVTIPCNASGQIVLCTNIPTHGDSSIMLLSLGSTNGAAYLTNMSLQFAGKAPYRHIDLTNP